MEITYKSFLAKEIDLSPLGLLPPIGFCPYYCTPKGASIIGVVGVDGIHFCFIRGFKETVFAVSPENYGGPYVLPAAKSFSDFLSLLLACGDASLIEQAWALGRERFYFLLSLSKSEENRALLTEIENKCKLSPISDPYGDIKALQNDFDYTKIKYTEDFYDIDMNPSAPQKREWLVQFGGGFYCDVDKRKAGREDEISFPIAWGRYRLHILSSYYCREGLVADIAFEVDKKKLYEYLKNEDKADRWGSAPYNIEFTSHIELNGKKCPACFTSSYLLYDEEAKTLGYKNSPEEEAAREHYSLSKDEAYMLFRLSYKWYSIRKPEINSFLLCLQHREEEIALPKLHNVKAGDSFILKDPVTDEEYTLNIEDVRKESFSVENGGEFSCPSNGYIVTYTTAPELDRKAFLLRDSEDGDRPVRNDDYVPEFDFAPAEFASAIAVIGGADGPAAVFGAASYSGVKPSRTPHLRSVATSLYFTLPSQVTLTPVFRKKPVEDISVKLK